MPKIALGLFAVIVALLGGFSAHAAGAAEINVLCSGAMRAVLQQLTPAFEESSGDKLVVEYTTAGKVEENVAADEAIDVAILTKPGADKLVRAAKLVGGTTTVLARMPIGLAVKSGAPHPDISSVEAVKRTLLDAKSVAYVDPASGGTSSIFLAQTLERLGIAAELKSKTRLVWPSPGQSSPRVGEVVQRGEAEIGIQPNQRADGGRRHRRRRTATSRSAEPGLGIHDRLSSRKKCDLNRVPASAPLSPEAPERQARLRCSL